MKKTLCVGAIAFAMFGLLSNLSTSYANEYAGAGVQSSQASASIDIDRIRGVLKLTSAQERYWPPVESALRGIARHQASSEPEGLMRRISRRVVSIVLNSAAVERLAVAARPLLAALSDEQKRAAGGLAQEMGLGPVVMAALK